MVLVRELSTLKVKFFNFILFFQLNKYFLKKRMPFSCYRSKIGLLVFLSLTTFSWVVRLSSHMGAEKHPTVGSSGEYWSINESLNQGFAGMKSFKTMKAKVAVKFVRKLKNWYYVC